MNEHEEILQPEEGAYSEERRTLLKAAWTVPAVMALGSIPSFASTASVTDTDICTASSGSQNGTTVQEGSTSVDNSDSGSECGNSTSNSGSKGSKGGSKGGTPATRIGGFGEISQGGYTISTDKVNGL